MIQLEGEASEAAEDSPLLGPFGVGKAVIDAGSFATGVLLCKP
jgi:hypothetical protein